MNSFIDTGLLEDGIERELSFGIRVLETASGKDVTNTVFNPYRISYPNETKDPWKFEDGRKYDYMELHRFLRRKGDSNTSKLDLTKYTVEITRIDKFYMEAMQLQVGSYSMLGKRSKTNAGNYKFTFNLNDKNINGYLKGKWNPSDGTTDRGVRNFTFQPYYPNRAFGKDSIVLSFGPKYYDQTSNPKTTRVIPTSTLKNNSDVLKVIRVDGQKYEYKLGTIAENILKTPDQEQTKNISIVLNGDGTNTFVDQSKVSLNQYMIYRKVGEKDENFRTVGIGFNKMISVVGSKNNKIQPLISGLSNSLKPYNGTNLEKFNNAMLRVFSSYEGQGGPSIAIKGIQFGDAPSSNAGTVWANAIYQPIVKQSTWFKKGLNFNQKVANVIDANERGKGLYHWKYGTTKNQVLFKDNQLVAWIGASDGLESHSPKLWQEKNFYLVGDDVLKVGTRNGVYNEITIHSGPSGSPIALSDYGISNGPVNNNRIEPYIHRIIQGSNDLGGVIANRSYFSQQMAANTAKTGINSNTFNNLYIPQMSNGKGVTGLQANQMFRQGIIAATQDIRTVGYSGNLYKQVIDGANYNAGGYILNNYQNNMIFDNSSAFKAAYYKNYTKDYKNYSFTNPLPTNGQASKFQVKSKMDMFKQGVGNDRFNIMPIGLKQTVDIYGVSINNTTEESIAQHQVTSTDAILNFTNVIHSSFVELKIDIITNSAFHNDLFLVDCEIDEVTGRQTIGGVEVGNTDEFREAVRDQMNSQSSIFLGNYGGEGKAYNKNITITSEEAELFALVLVNPLGDIFTIGETSSYGFTGNTNVRENADNSFFFEDLKGLGDNDRNDMIVDLSLT